MTDLYAWATPAFVKGTPVDHTWVTTYDYRTTPLPAVSGVMEARQDYWFCWGTFHATGGTPALQDGSIYHGTGDLAFARCVATSNADCRTAFGARGTIFSYGVDGVCHQRANQILYAAGLSAGSAPLTVARARGYRASTAVYGTYGLQHAAWRSKISACSQAAASLPHPSILGAGGAMSHRVSPPPPDEEFEQHVGRVLAPGNMTAAARLLQLRAQFQASSAMDAHALSAPTADALNARNQRFSDDASKILSRDEFIAVFDVAPGETIELVVPALNP